MFFFAVNIFRLIARFVDRTQTYSAGVSEERVARPAVSGFNQ
jgi:hypothetical protein